MYTYTYTYIHIHIHGKKAATVAPAMVRRLYASIMFVIIRIVHYAHLLFRYYTHLLFSIIYFFSHGGSAELGVLLRTSRQPGSLRKTTMVAACHTVQVTVK